MKYYPIFYLIGIDYKTSKVSVREEASLLKKRFIQFLSTAGISSARVLYTCNRFEVCDFAKDYDEVFRRLNILKESFNYLLGNNYTFIGEKEVFKHLLRLACGLESQLRGESQILEQLINFCNQRDFPENLKQIMDKAISAAKFIREKAGIGKKNYNIANLVLEDVAEKIGKSSLKIAIVGTGKIAELFASGGAQGIKFYFLAHKNYQKAEELAKKAKGLAVSLHEIDKIILEADVLASATASPHYILRADFFRKVMERRKKPLYVYDLAIPRDIDPESSNAGGVILKNIDDLAPLFEKHNQRIEKELLRLEYFVQEQAATCEEFFYEESVEGRRAR